MLYEVITLVQTLSVLEHHGNGNEANLMLEVLVPGRLRGGLDHVDVLARAAVQRVEHTAEHFDRGFVDQAAEHRNAEGLLVGPETALLVCEEHENSDADADNRDNEIEDIRDNPIRQLEFV